MPSYKLTYFDVRGRAELARILFHYTNTPFEDIRLKREEWQQLKATGKAPFGLLPILEVDGTVISSSAAIVTYIAEVTGLTSDTPLERARGNMMMDGLHDVAVALIPNYFIEKDEAKKAELVTNFIDKVVPPWVEKFEAFFKLNGGGDGWFVGSKVTYVDFAIFNMFDFLSSTLQKDINLLLPKDKAPKLVALVERVKALPALDAYLKKRP